MIKWIVRRVILRLAIAAVLITISGLATGMAWGQAEPVDPAEPVAVTYLEHSRMYNNTETGEISIRQNLAEHRIYDASTQAWTASIITQDKMTTAFGVVRANATLCQFAVHNTHGTYLFTDGIELRSHNNRQPYAGSECIVQAGKHHINLTKQYEGRPYLTYQYNIDPEQSALLNTLMVVYNIQDIPTGYTVRHTQYMPGNGTAYVKTIQSDHAHEISTQYNYDPMEVGNFTATGTIVASETLKTIAWDLTGLPAIPPGESIVIDPAYYPSFGAGSGVGRFIVNTLSTSWAGNTFPWSTISGSSSYYNVATGRQFHMFLNTGTSLQSIVHGTYIQMLAFNVNLPSNIDWSQYQWGYITVSSFMDAQNVVMANGRTDPRVFLVLHDVTAPKQTGTTNFAFDLPLGIEVLSVWDDGSTGSYVDSSTPPVTGDSRGIAEGDQYGARVIHTPDVSYLSNPARHSYNAQAHLQSESHNLHSISGYQDCSKRPASTQVRECGFGFPLVGVQRLDDGREAIYDLLPVFAAGNYDKLNFYIGTKGHGDTSCLFNCYNTSDTYANSAAASNDSDKYGKDAGSPFRSFRTYVNKNNYEIQIQLLPELTNLNYVYKKPAWYQPLDVSGTVQPTVTRTDYAATLQFPVQGAVYYTVQYTDPTTQDARNIITPRINNTHTESSIQISGLQPATSLPVVITASNGLEKRDIQYTIPPIGNPNPTNLRATSIDATRINLTWEDVGNNLYSIQVNGTEVATTRNKNIEITNLDRWTVYSLQVVAMRDGNEFRSSKLLYSFAADTTRQVTAPLVTISGENVNIDLRQPWGNTNMRVYRDDILLGTFSGSGVGQGNRYYQLPRDAPDINLGSKCTPAEFGVIFYTPTHTSQEGTAQGILSGGPTPELTTVRVSPLNVTDNRVVFVTPQDGHCTTNYTVQIQVELYQHGRVNLDRIAYTGDVPERFNTVTVHDDRMTGTPDSARNFWFVLSSDDTTSHSQGPYKSILIHPDAFEEGIDVMGAFNRTNSVNASLLDNSRAAWQNAIDSNVDNTDQKNALRGIQNTSTPFEGTIPFVDIIRITLGSDMLGVTNTPVENLNDDNLASAGFGSVSLIIIAVSAVAAVGFRRDPPIIGVVVASAVIWAAQWTGLLTWEVTTLTWSILAMLGLAALVRSKLR